MHVELSCSTLGIFILLLFNFSEYFLYTILQFLRSQTLKSTQTATLLLGMPAFSRYTNQARMTPDILWTPQPYQVRTAPSGQIQTSPVSLHICHVVFYLSLLMPLQLHVIFVASLLRAVPTWPNTRTKRNAWRSKGSRRRHSRAWRPQLLAWGPWGSLRVTALQVHLK